MAARGTTTALLLTLALLTGCTGGDPGDAGRTAAGTTPTSSPPAGSASPSVAGSGVAETSTLVCGNSIGGDAPPGDYTVVLGAVALPASPRHAALQAAPAGNGPTPRLFAKTGLLVRVGTVSEIDVATSVDPHVGIAWNNGPTTPSRRFVVPACPDTRGTGWLVYPGGYWSDVPVCLPLDVRAGDEVQRVEIGVGTACPGQSAPVIR